MKFFSTVSKTALAMTLGAALVNMGGCNQEELTAAKDQLAKTASERDQLKGQVTTQQAQMDAMKKDLDDTKAKLADAEKAAAACAQPAAAPAGTPAAPAGKPAAHAAGHKAAAGKPEKLPVAAKPDDSKPQGSEANPIKVQAKPGGSY